MQVFRAGDEMGKQVIVVVHGVGVRDPGVSGDLLAATLDSNPPTGTEGRAAFQARSQEQRDEDALRPISADDFLLREPEAYAKAAKYAIFHARIRRYGEKGDPGKASRRDRVISDFYWGDVTGTGGGFVQVLTGIFRLMLGLTHAVRENAWSVFPDAARRDHRFFRKAAGTAALVIHGPLFALNLMLALFALALGGSNFAGLWNPNSVSGQVFGLEFWPVIAMTVAGSGVAIWAWRRKWPFAFVFVAGGVAVAGLIAGFHMASDGQIMGLLAGLTIAAALVLRANAHAFLLRHLSDWLMISALVLMIYLAFPGLHDWMMPRLAFMSVNGGGIGPGGPLESAVVLRSGGLLVVSAVLCWGLVIVIAFGLLLRRAVRATMAAVAGNPGTKITDFQAEAIALMLLLWLVVTGAFWGAGLKLAVSTGVHWGGSSVEVAKSLLFVPVAIGLFLTLLALMGATFLATMRRSSLDGAVAAYVADREAQAEAGRLVVAAVGIWFLRAIVVLAGLVVILAALRAGGCSCLGEFTAPHMANLDGATIAALSVLAAVAALAAGFGRSALGSVIGIVVDVLAYINNYSWNSWDDLDLSKSLGEKADAARVGVRVDPDLLPHSLTVFEGMIALFKPVTKRRGPRGYWFRRRIQDRLRVLVAELIRDEAPDELLFIAHSQGTMIAADVIEMEGQGWRDMAGDKLKIRLVTMGSPIRHVYNHYFPRSFPMIADRMTLARIDAGGVLSDWINIFRIDDFIGTHIDPDMGHQMGTLWPQEIAVPKNGHTMYWVDINVAQHLRPRAAF
jgi:hypothetical protein